MGKRDKKVDDYIARSAPFAKPIMTHLRQLVHKACPEATETIKWGFPHFEYKGMLCSMAAFKNHCSFAFWKGVLMKDPHDVMTVVGKTSMGSFDKIASPEDLPSDKILLEYIKEAVKLNDEDVKIPKKAPAKISKTLRVPDDFMKALRRDKNALATFEGFSNSNKKDYIEWITGAKTDETRETRIATSIEWLGEGKVRNWKYIKK